MASFVGTSGPDNLTGTASADTFDMTLGGVDTVSANGGDDLVDFGATLTAADTIKGGAGFDILNLDGDYSAGLTLSGSTLKASNASHWPTATTTGSSWPMGMLLRARS